MARRLASYMRQHHLALLALFLALGGTSYAAATSLLPKNSVGSAQVINGSLKTSDLNAQVRKALKRTRGPQGAPGARGPTGSQGPQGAKGANGADGTALAYAKVNSNGTVDSAHSKNIASANVSHPTASAY